MSDTADAILIESILTGDESAFAQLVGRYQGRVWGTVYRTLGNSSENEDAVQEIFLRVLVSLPRFNTQRPFGPWLLRITTNYCIDLIRRRKARKQKLWSDLTEGEQARLFNTMVSREELENETTEDTAACVKIAQSLLEELEPKRRVAFVLREIEGRSYAEIAASLKIPEVTVRVRVSRARAELQKRYRRYGRGFR